MTTRRHLLLVLAASLAGLAHATAQPLGTFRWQLQPYCNIVTVTVVQDGAQYHITGTDDQCGTPRRASVVGLAFPNPDGSIGFGLTSVTTPGGAPVHIDASISLAAVSGTWRDSGGLSGTFVFTPGAGTGGSPRPQPTSLVPSAIRLLADGGLLAGGAPDASTIPATGAGTRMMWYPGKAAFRAGYVDGTQWDDANVGASSAALGINTVASGASSIAIGMGTRATGRFSVATGFGTTASGEGSTAMGLATVASGDSATATGNTTLASGLFSTAIGFGTVAAGSSSFAGGDGASAQGSQALAFGLRASASGAGSVALGNRAATTATGTGSFIFADRSSANALVSNVPNEFGARFAGGFYLYTRADLSTGAALAASGSSWAALSDVHAKENFREVDGEDLLEKLARVPVREWNYKAQDASFRHMGPTAQDFRAAFGLGDFPLRINTIDADGVALAGVKALGARTTALRATIDELRRENETLLARLTHLETLLGRH